MCLSQASHKTKDGELATLYLLSPNVRFEMPVFQQGFPCLTENVSVVSRSQPDQWSGNAWLAGWFQMLPLPCVPAKTPHTIHSIEKPAHFHLQPALFIFLSELVTINIIKSHKSRWCGLELPAVLPLVNCLSCPAAWLPEKASHQFPMVSLHFFTSHPHPKIFATFTVDIYKGERGKGNWRQKIKESFTSEIEDCFSNNDLSLSTASTKRDHFKGSAGFH